MHRKREQKTLLQVYLTECTAFELHSLHSSCIDCIHAALTALTAFVVVVYSVSAGTDSDLIYAMGAYGTKCPDTTISKEYFQTFFMINDQCNLASFVRAKFQECGGRSKYK